jgi:hypothetical protein
VQNEGLPAIFEQNLFVGKVYSKLKSILSNKFLPKNSSNLKLCRTYCKRMRDAKEFFKILPPKPPPQFL